MSHTLQPAFYIYEIWYLGPITVGQCNNNRHNNSNIGAATAHDVNSAPRWAQLEGLKMILLRINRNECEIYTHRKKQQEK